MSVYESNKIRNIAIVGHQGSGKTTLVESLIFTSGGIEKKGEVEKKTTVSDYLPDEQRRQSSVSTAVVVIYYKAIWEYLDPFIFHAEIEIRSPSVTKVCVNRHFNIGINRMCNSSPSAAFYSVHLD